MVVLRLSIAEPSGIATGVVSDVCVEVIMSVSRASWIAVTHRCTSSGLCACR